MASIVKTIVATGASSGLGFEAVKQLLNQTQPYKFLLGCSNTNTAQTAYDELKYDSKKHSVTVLPLDLSDLRTVKKFAAQTLKQIGSDKLDFLFLNAATVKVANEPGVNGSKWSEPYVVNHLSQHYLIHLLREKLVESKSRLVITSSGAATSVKDPSNFDKIFKAQSGADFFELYGPTKFALLLSTHWWRRQLKGDCDVLAVSPGFIPDTGLARNSQFEFPPEVLKDAKTVETGAQSLLAAFTRDDFPEDTDQVFLTSWGEWWPKEQIKLTLDKDLQDKWSPSKDQIEKEELVD
ncbi:NAD(P)-binding protein [Microthyrium microscopicum]|uniref:NAD(P)-binding protein n=1 Tax=Microthyrium microscopicum TaxID=703497 RepID=A0A6A6TYV0_9PEZI|nr:NAD(P)-binding protein [Microthyrium microscopicum]